MSYLKKVQWLTLPFLSLTLLSSVLGLVLYIPYRGVHPLEPIACAVFVSIVAMVISGGYHRYFAHKTFHCHPALKIFYLVVGAAAFQQSALVWAADHRMHHRYVDTDRDPYSIKKGFWWAHVGWIFAAGHRLEDWRSVPDLSRLRNVAPPPWVRLRWPGPSAFRWPCLAIGRPVGVLLWAGLLRAS
jgi:stearoyl-CoA desaturase (delta-9 desaturase)